MQDIQVVEGLPTTVETFEAFAVAVAKDPIAALVAIQDRGDAAETVAIKELVASVAGVPESNIGEMVASYREAAKGFQWSKGTVAARASNLKGVLECARTNEAFRVLVNSHEKVGLQKAYAIRSELLKGMKDQGKDLPVPSEGLDGSEESEEVVVALTTDGAYVKALTQAAELAKLAGRLNHVAMLMEMIGEVSQDVLSQVE